MSSLVPNIVYLRRIFLYNFILEKFAVEAHRNLVSTYSGNALSEITNRDWFRRLKIRTFELEDQEHSGHEKKFEGKNLEELLDQHPRQTLTATVSNRLKAL
ncbi:hypothetical protein TNIN_46291 [Trichonephila inaurata madagascariensis]|uniref:Mos1 transposase HTH domain-containing protein n=1 Tax=Trichonephila inaurata madagascariensis TaxID=2747483 RepID=A0A8X6XHH2_9ARAC|nr:hypothetical protein TNIN_46291 [Trichonephila inaurata madagascariensis]